MGTSHRQKPVRTWSAGCGAASASSSAFPTATRWRSATAAPPPSGRPPPPGSCASAPSTSPTASSRRSSPRRPPAAPFLADPILVEAEPGDAPEPAADPDADVIAWAHNETSTGVMVDVQPPRGRRRRARPRRRDLGRRRPAARRRARPTSTTSPRRRPSAPTAASGWPRSARPRSSGSPSSTAPTDRWQPAFLSLQTAVENSRKDQTYNTPAVATLILLADQIEWMLAGGGLDWCVQRTGASSTHLYTWAEATGFASPFVADPAKRSLVVGTIDFDDSVDAAALAATLRANGIVDVEPYRKLGRNQLRIGMFPAVEPADVEALTACIDWAIENAEGVLRPDEGPGQGEDRRLGRRPAARELRRRARPRDVRRGARRGDRLLRRDPDPLGDPDDRRADRARRAAQGDRPRRHRRRQRRHRRPPPAAA